MAGMTREMRADIVIGGKGNLKDLIGQLDALGNHLESIGRSMTNQVTRPLVSFGKEAVDKYVEFEDNLLDAEGALKTQYDSTSELGRAMDSLSESAMNWAQNSRFTTGDITSAIAEAAHAGWDAEKILAGMPKAMEVSLAGGMELADGLQYLVDITNAAGLSFDDLGTLTDQWAYAANRSSTTIPEMGQAMQKMGASMQFVKGDMAGLTTMLAVLANNGTKGTSAGTLMRNVIMRLIAPTQKAAEAMDGLDLTSEELEEIYQDSEGLEDTVKLLKDMGFTVYDTGGKLRSFTDIFKDLDAVTRDMTEEKRNEVLATIFPTRTMSGALALLEAARDDYGGLYDDVKNKSAGYGEELSVLMESGLGGTLRSLEASWDVLETKIGGVLADDVGKVAGGLESIVNSLIDMDDTKLAALVGGLEGLAAAGPALLGVGAALKLIGTFGNLGMVGKIALGVTALAVLDGAMYKFLAEMREAKFGEMEIDSEALGASLNELAAQFDEPTEKIEKYNEAFQQSLTGYEEASTLFAEKLTNTFVTGQKMTADDYTNLKDLGKRMVDSIIQGAKDSFREDRETLNWLASETDMDGTMWSQMITMMDTGAQQVIDEATRLGEEIDEAITAAFKNDHEIDEAEYTNITGLMERENQLMLAQVRADQRSEEEEFLRNHQGLSYDTIQDAVDQYSGQRDSQIESARERIEKLKNRVYQNAELYALENGVDRETAYKQYQPYIDELNNDMAELEQEITTSYAQRLIDTVYAGFTGSDFGEGLRTMMGLTEKWIKTGGKPDFEDYGAYNDAWEKGGGQLWGILGYFLNEAAGAEGIWNKVAEYREDGNNSMADLLTNLGLIAMGAAQGPFELDYNDLMDQGILKGYNTAGVDITPYARTPEAGPVMEDEWASGLSDEAAQNPITIPLEPDDEPLEAAITAHDGQSVTVNVQANMSAFMAAIASAKAALANLFGGATEKAGGGANANKPVAAMYAEGGRATEASIFAEAGTPEWAIPEEHTERTAQLLREAARASGFGWGELLSGQTGGTSGTSLVYSPVIYATDTRGVRDELMEDKKRLEKWLREKNMIDRISVYA